MWMRPTSTPPARPIVTRRDDRLMAIGTVFLTANAIHPTVGWYAPARACRRPNP